MQIAKREGELKDAFWHRFAVLYPAAFYFVMNHQDMRKSGYPDSSVHGFGRSTWWEFKHATPDFLSPLLQEITCLRLAKHSYCRYVLFVETSRGSRIVVVHPTHVHRRRGKLNFASLDVEASFPGFDFDKLAGFIHAQHRPESH